MWQIKFGWFYDFLLKYKYDQKLCDQPNYYLEGSLVAKLLNGIVYHQQVEAFFVKLLTISDNIA